MNPRPADEPRWLAPDELDAWRNLSAVLLLLPGRLDEALKPHGMTFFDYSILTALSGAVDRSMAMSELAFLSQGSLSRLSHAAKRLEQRGWVARCGCPEDGRVTLASLTELGYAKLVETAPTHVESVRQLVFDELGQEHVGPLQETMSAIVRGLTPGRVAPWDRSSRAVGAQ